MLGLEKIADSFDRFHAAWDKTVDSTATDYVEGYSRVWGPEDWHTRGAAVQVGLLWAINAFVGGMLGGFADLARLGEGVKKGSFGGVAQDGLRLLTFAGPAMQVVRRGGAMLIAGNQVSNSCIMTSNAFALRLSATRIGITIDELARAGGMVPPTTTPGYVGEMAADIAKALKAVGARVRPHKFGPVVQIEDVERLARNSRGPVLFEADWFEPEEIRAGGAHAMTAFRDLFGRIMVADQYGIRPLRKMAEIEGSVTRLADISVRSSAYVIEEALMLRNANALSSVPGVASAVKIAVEAYYVPGPSLVAIDNSVRTALHRPTRAQERQARRKKVIATRPGATAAPLTGDARKLLAVIPATGEITRLLAMSRSGLDYTEFRAALGNLEAANKVVVRRAAHDTLTILGIRRA
jgi:hypothetical protein